MMASRFLVAALGGSMALAHDGVLHSSQDSYWPISGVSVASQGHSYGPSDGYSIFTGAAAAATTALPTAIMPSDVTGVSGTPSTLVIDTQAPPSSWSSWTWFVTTTAALPAATATTSHGVGNVTQANVSGVAAPTVGVSAGNSSSTGSPIDKVSGAAHAAFNKISIGVLALCVVASAAVHVCM